MTAKFLVSGMPRCRTAWFSVVMSTVNSICYHEPVSRVESFEELELLWRPKYGERVGISDSAMMFQLPRILQEIKPRTLLVERRIPDVLSSLKRYFHGTNYMLDYDEGRKYLGKIQGIIDEHRSHPMVRTVKFEDLRDYETVKALIDWLAPGIEVLDLKSLMRMNIQVDVSYVMGLLRQPHTQWYREPCSTSEKSATV